MVAPDGVSQNLFTSRDPCTTLPCGHAMHSQCFSEFCRRSYVLYCLSLFVPICMELQRRTPSSCGGASFVSAPSPASCVDKALVLLYSFKCPLCSTPVADMSRQWRRLDRERALTPMPEDYARWFVEVRDRWGTNADRDTSREGWCHQGRLKTGHIFHCAAS